MATTVPDQPRAAPGAKLRRDRLRQALIFQGVMAALLLIAAALSTGASRAMYLVSLLLPGGLALMWWRAWREGEAVRVAGTWSRDFETAHQKRTLSAMAVVLVLWAAALVALVVFF